MTDEITVGTIRRWVEDFIPETEADKKLKAIFEVLLPEVQFANQMTEFKSVICYGLRVLIRRHDVDEEVKERAKKALELISKK